MNGPEVLRIVDAIHRDKNIDKEIVFEGIEQAILSAARKHYGEDEELEVDIDRETGEPALRHTGELVDPDELGEVLGRVPAQTAKQVMIQRIREAERDALFEEFSELQSQIVTGVVTRVDAGGTATVNLGKVEGILPRSEQIPGDEHRVGERVRAVILEVKKAGSRVKIILSRTHPDLVRRLFELEIPEVADHTIEVRSLAREAGYRSKVAVSCYDPKIDCVGACVGVRGSRIKSIVAELAGERIDIVRWNDSLQVLVPNALQPAEVEDVILCPMLGKVIVLVQDDQLSLAIGKKGQNVRLASKLVGWDIHVMTQSRLDEQLEKSVGDFSTIPGVSEELAESLVAQGFFTFDDLSVIEPDQLAELGGLTPEQCDEIIAVAEREAERVEREERQAAEAARRAAAEAALQTPEPSAEAAAEVEELSVEESPDLAALAEEAAVEAPDVKAADVDAADSAAAAASLIAESASAAVDAVDASASPEAEAAATAEAEPLFEEQQAGSDAEAHAAEPLAEEAPVPADLSTAAERTLREADSAASGY